MDGNNARELQLSFAGIQFLETGSVYGFAQDSGCGSLLLDVTTI